MTPLKTIIATAVIAVGGTVAAFSGLHIGQTNADAAANQAIKAKTTYTVTLSAKQLAKLMHGQTGATQQVKHHRRQAKRHAVRYQNNGGSSGSYGSRSSSGRSGYRCYGNGGSHSGSWGGGSHSGGGGCW